MRKPPTGEPCAGEPHARFGGRGGVTLPDPYHLSGIGTIEFLWIYILYMHYRCTLYNGKLRQVSVDFKFLAFHLTNLNFGAICDILIYR
jgi:hypothetical protein